MSKHFQDRMGCLDIFPFRNKFIYTDTHAHYTYLSGRCTLLYIVVVVVNEQQREHEDGIF